MVLNDPLIGRQIGSFRIDRLLGRGGMGRVYYAWDVHLHRPVALKVIDERYRDDTAYTDRFIREARAIASWRHPNILQVYQAGEADGIYYFAMEFIEGANLEQIIQQAARSGGRLTVGRVLAIGRSIANALDYAHARGVIHRDVKPSNVIVADDGRVVLADFGLAMSVEQGTMGRVFGSPHYIAPEQARNSSWAVSQSDLYALGVILYRMLTGRLPFDDPSPTVLAFQHISMPPPAPRSINPALSPQVETVLLKALAKEPQDRYASGQELIRALEQAFDAPVVATRPMPAVSPAPPAAPPPDTSATTAAIHVPTPNPEPVFQPAPPAPRRTNSWTATCLSLLLIGLCAVVSGAVILLNRAALSRTAVAANPTGTAEVLAAATEEQFPVTPTIEAGNNSTEISIIPSPTLAQTETPSPTPEPTATQVIPTPTAIEPLSPAKTYDLILVWRKDDTFYLVNLGPEALPLPNLVLQKQEGEEDNPEDRISGEAWGVEALQAGQCVAVWQDNGKPQPPKGLRCEEVGERQERGGSGKIWTAPFDVYFGDQKVKSCENYDAGVCILQFAAPVEG